MSLTLITKTYHRLQRYLTNSYWLMGEKLVGAGLGFIATVLVARYLGPEQYGTLAYALSLVSIFAAAGHMGLHGLVVRDLVKDPDGRNEILGTTSALKFLGMTTGYVTLIIYATAYEGFGSVEFNLIIIGGASLLFRASNVIEFWFQAFVQAKYSVIANLTAHALSTAFRITLVLLGSSLVYFATAQLIHSILAAFLLLLMYRLNSVIKLSKWRFNWSRARELLRQGWVIYLGSIFAVIYLKVDQVMLRWFTDAKEVGQYAAAAQLSEAWYFLPTVIVASFFPRLIALSSESPDRFHHRLQQLFDALFMMGLVVAIAMTLAAPHLINLLYGPEFSQSAEILVIHTWAAIFIFMRAALSRWILIENALYFSLVTQGLGALANLALNYYLIPVYGGPGAAWATLLSYSVASYVSLAFYRRTRVVFWQMSLAMLAPIRYPLSYAFHQQRSRGGQ
ncbi:MAG: flippase [Gammaproteobacteria bacterium]|nr:flippase [Gammaproteobacteria bacterium]